MCCYRPGSGKTSLILEEDVLLKLLPGECKAKNTDRLSGCSANNIVRRDIVLGIAKVLLILLTRLSVLVVRGANKVISGFIIDRQDDRDSAYIVQVSTLYNVYERQNASRACE